MKVKRVKTRRALTTLCECCHAIIHAAEGEAFLENICKIIVKDNRYQLACVGYAEKDMEKKVIPVAKAGSKANYIDGIEVRWSDTKLGRGPDGTSIRTKKHILTRETCQDASFAPWRKRAINFDLASVLGLPLIIEDEAIGCLTVYSSEPDSFDEEEIDLLKKLATKLSFGIKSLRIETDLKKSEQELLNSREELRSLAKHLRESREKERIRIARDIHDDLGQMLSAIKLDLTWVKKRLTSDQQELIDKLEETSTMVIDASETVQRITSDLRPAILNDLGLVDSIEWLARDFEKRTGIKHHLSINNVPNDLCEQLSVELFRIFQETLTNVMRHAKATRLIISMREENESLILQIKDNGKGISKKQINAVDSFGLIGMRERVAPWRGTLEFKGINGKGTTVTVIIPLKKEVNK